MFRSPEILFRDLNRLSWIQNLLDYTPWKHASNRKNNKRVQTVKMAVKYKKKSALPNKYSPIFGILWFTHTHKKGEKTLTKNV